MKYVDKNSIYNIPDTELFDNMFQFNKIQNYLDDQREVIFLGNLLSKKKNNDLVKKITEKPAMYANMYSARDELDIFIEIFENTLKTQKKIHIIGVTLAEEIEILEKYYEKLGFMREDINCFQVNFSIPLVTVSVNIENLIWKGSDYKKMRKSIFFIPPIRESSQNKAMFKGINRGVIAGIHTGNFGANEKQFLSDCISQEKILPLTMGRVLFHNLIDAGITKDSSLFNIFY